MVFRSSNSTSLLVSSGSVAGDLLLRTDPCRTDAAVGLAIIVLPFLVFIAALFRAPRLP